MIYRAKALPKMKFYLIEYLLGSYGYDVHTSITECDSEDECLEKLNIHLKGEYLNSPIFETKPRAYIIKGEKIELKFETIVNVKKV